jgi:hypothetical protein
MHTEVKDRVYWSVDKRFRAPYMTAGMSLCGELLNVFYELSGPPSEELYMQFYGSLFRRPIMGNAGRAVVLTARKIAQDSVELSN